MEEIFENDDALKRLIREEGLLTPSHDFTGRVMQLVEATETRTVTVYKPLLNRTAWILISAFMTILVAVCWRVAAANPDETVYSDTIKPVFDFLNNLHIAFDFPTGGLLIATIAVACIGMLLSLDIIISYKNHGVSA